MADPEEPRPEGGEPRSSRFRRLGRKLMGEERVEGRFSARDVMEAVLEGSDKAKSEVVRIVAREVRSYLEELGLREVLTDYSLEVHASINLRKLAESEKRPKGAE
jgi:hypothetical protein